MKLATAAGWFVDRGRADGKEVSASLNVPAAAIAVRESTIADAFADRDCDLIDGTTARNPTSNKAEMVLLTLAPSFAVHCSICGKFTRRGGSKRRTNISFRG